jgi:hypothetical protein
MNVEIGTETAQFPEKEDINVIFLAMRHLDKKTTASSGPSNATQLRRFISSEQKRDDVIWIQQSGPSILDPHSGFCHQDA